MIADRIENMGRYLSAVPRLDEVERMLKDPAFSPDDAATHGGLTVLHKAYDNRPDGARQFEVHERTVDLMLCLKGAEVIHLRDAGGMRAVRAIGEGADGHKLAGGPEGTALLLEAGWFVAILPGQAHMTAGRTEKAQGVEKLVVKLPYDAPSPGCPCTAQCVRHGQCAQCVAWHRSPGNSLPSCLREKGRAMIEEALNRQTKGE